MYSKNSKPDDHVLQNCCAPAIIGGEIDMIIGIRYNRIAPELIHQLPYGLAINSIYMGTHNPTHNSAIGGLHESFYALHQKSGNNTRSLQILTAAISDYYKNGPPGILHLPLNKSEEIEDQISARL